jgi:hypothetical protein
MYVCLCGYVAVSVAVDAGVGVVWHILTENAGYWPDVILIRAYLCDIALNDVLCDNLPDFHVLGANTHHIVFGGLYL